MKKFMIMLLSGAVLTAGMSSCDKKKITDPTLIVTKTTPQDDADMKAGRDVTFDVTASGPNEMAGLKIEAQYESNPVEVIRDTNITGTTYFTMQAIYQIPDSAKAGEKSVLTFTVTDSKGKTATKTHTINITGSTPIITAIPDRQKAPEGDTIMVAITANSKDDNIVNVKVSQSVDGAQNQLVKEYSNSSPTFSQTLEYKVPPAGSGKQILLSIVATDASGDDNLITVPLVIE